MKRQPDALGLVFDKETDDPSGHQGAFTWQGKRLDELLVKTIKTTIVFVMKSARPGSPSKDENESACVSRWNSEIPIETEVDAKLNTDVYNVTEFDKPSGIAISGFTFLVGSYNRSLKPSASTTLHDGFSQSRSDFKLRLLRLNSLTFNGSFTEDKISITDFFKAAVDSNRKWIHSEKLNYLRACVKGDVAKLMCSVEKIDTNYAIFTGWLYGKNTEHWRGATAIDLFSTLYAGWVTNGTPSTIWSHKLTQVTKQVRSAHRWIVLIFSFMSNFENIDGLPAQEQTAWLLKNRLNSCIREIEQL